MNLRRVSVLELLVKDEEGYLPADYRNVLNRWKIHFCQLLTVIAVKDVRKTEVHLLELLV
jgi:hypothetical protein